MGVVFTDARVIDGIADEARDHVDVVVGDDGRIASIEDHRSRDWSAGPQPPCTGHMPNCLDPGGCITVSALPASPTSIAVPVEWTSLDYDLVPQALTGISVKPELSPPILTA